MKEKDTILEYIGQIFTAFGVVILVLSIVSLLIEDTDKVRSTMFVLGGKGLSVYTLFQFFLMTVIAIIVKFVFVTDTLIKNMSIVGRIVGIVMSMLVVSVAFIIIFRWIPIDSWVSWLMFILSFSLSFGGSVLVTFLKEKSENEKMEAALQRFKEREQSRER